ncbi:MAG: hypothetical protein PSY14_17005 [bacterium]|nr:hypothetical protein [bacterium]
MQDRKPAARETIDALRALKQQFDAAAEGSEKSARVAADALLLAPELAEDAAALRKHFSRTAEDQRQLAQSAGRLLRKLEQDEAKKVAAEKARFRTRTSDVRARIKSARVKNTAVAVFIDRSGSITAKPFSAALDGAAVLDAPVCLYAGARDAEWVRGDILDPETRKALFKSGPSSDFKPAVTEMIKTAAVNKLNGQKSHFVVISDGGFHDYPAAKVEMEKLLRNHLRATVDFVIFGRTDTGMEILSEQLAKEFPGKVKAHIVNGPAYWQGTEEDLSQATQATVAAAITARLHPPRKAKPAAQPSPT